MSAFEKNNDLHNSIKTNWDDFIHLYHFNPNDFVYFCVPIFSNLALHKVNKPLKENQKEIINSFE